MAIYNTNPYTNPSMNPYVYSYPPVQNGGATFTPYLNQNLGIQNQGNNAGNILTVYVNSEDEVNNYPVAAGTTVLLMSFNLKKFWLKSTNTNGVPEPVRVFPFEETTQTPVSVQPSNGVSREEFDALSKNVAQLIKDLGGGSNNG